MSEGADALRGPAFHFAVTSHRQRNVYGRKDWMRREVTRLYGPWLKREASAIAGGNGMLRHRMLRQAVDRLVVVDPTRFGKDDWPWLEEALRSELKWALKVAGRPPKPSEEERCDRD